MSASSKRVRLTLTVLGALLLTGCLGGRAVDYSQPEAVVRAFYRAVAEQDADQVADVCGVDAVAAERAREALETLVATGTSYDIEDLTLDVEKNDGQEARVRARVKMLVTRDDMVTITLRGEEQHLVQRDGRWYLLCP